jgi:hypothetical protein
MGVAGPIQPCAVVSAHQVIGILFSRPPGHPAFPPGARFRRGQNGQTPDQVHRQLDGPERGLHPDGFGEESSVEGIAADRGKPDAIGLGRSVDAADARQRQFHFAQYLRAQQQNVIAALADDFGAIQQVNGEAEAGRLIGGGEGRRGRMEAEGQKGQSPAKLREDFHDDGSLSPGDHPVKPKLL